mmetsp:Transcript_101563/g.291519  ORF Transcript_101563/g.291519 Transcript_101563/m.291519 type:complete len:217 (-) Transcript_101563:59-709(-)
MAVPLLPRGRVGILVLWFIADVIEVEVVAGPCCSRTLVLLQLAPRVWANSETALLVEVVEAEMFAGRRACSGEAIAVNRPFLVLPCLGPFIELGQPGRRLPLAWEASSLLRSVYAGMRGRSDGPGCAWSGLQSLRAGMRGRSDGPSIAWSCLRILRQREARGRRWLTGARAAENSAEARVSGEGLVRARRARGPELAMGYLREHVGVVGSAHLCFR